MLDHSLTDAQWTAFAQKYTEIGQRDYSSAKEEEQAEKALREMEFQMMAGRIIISTPGCTMNTILMTVVKQREKSLCWIGTVCFRCTQNRGAAGSSRTG